MKRILLVAAALTVILALSGCGTNNQFAPVEKTTIAVSTSWDGITSVSDDEYSQEDLKIAFVAGFVENDKTVDGERLAEALKWIKVDVSEAGDDVARKYQLFQDYILGASNVLSVENIATEPLINNHDGLVEIRQVGDSTTLCWRVASNGSNSWEIIYDDRRDGDTTRKFNILVYGIDRSLSDKEVTQYVLDTVKYRPDSLSAAYFAAFHVLLDANTLVADPAAYAANKPTYISTEGEKAFLDLRDALLAADTERRDLNAGELKNLFNSGSNGTTFNKSFSRGVGGQDVLAMIWHLKGGADLHALFRCGNVLLSGDDDDLGIVSCGPTDDKPDMDSTLKPGSESDPKPDSKPSSKESGGGAGNAGNADTGTGTQVPNNPSQPNGQPEPKPVNPPAGRLDPIPPSPTPAPSPQPSMPDPTPPPPPEPGAPTSAAPGSRTAPED